MQTHSRKKKKKSGRKTEQPRVNRSSEKQSALELEPPRHVLNYVKYILSNSNKSKKFGNEPSISHQSSSKAKRKKKHTANEVKTKTRIKSTEDGDEKGPVDFVETKH